MKTSLIILFILACSHLFGQRSKKATIDLSVKQVNVVSRISGASLPTDSFPNTGNTPRYSVGGTDLGISWDMENGQTGMFFGDTYGNDFKPVDGGPGPAGQWRNNVLAYISDTVYADGLRIDSMAGSDTNHLVAREVVHKGPGSYTAIPTAALHVRGVDYVHYFDLHQWKGWEINFSSYYASRDHGKTWNRCEEIAFPRGSKFSIAAFAKKAGYVYMVGGNSLRTSPAFLCRFREEDILRQEKYEYWNRQLGWLINKEAAATEIFSGPAGEASLFFNDYFNCWMIMYLNESTKSIELRTAAQITGPWSKPIQVVDLTRYPLAYGPFVLPQSRGRNLYFTMSMWKPYNVFLMHAELVRL